MTYAAPVEEILFALRHLGGLRASQVADMPGVPDDDTLEALLTEAGRFAAARMAPLYRTADQQGARFANGVVSTTPGFPELYRDWIAGGWNTVTAPEDQGGMGMPLAVGTADFVVAPHRLELGTEPAEFIDQRFHFFGGAGAGRVDPERAQHEPRHAFPVVLRSAGARPPAYCRRRGRARGAAR